MVHEAAQQGLRGRDEPSNIIVISSHVVRGTVGNRAAVFALETLEYQVWAVPTVTLSWHPGHGPATRIVARQADFAAMLEDLAGSRWIGSVKGILTGYLGDASQAVAIANLVDCARKANDDLIYVCDPVIGDSNGLYVPQETAQAIGEHLISRADLITPNRFELEWFTNKTLPDNVSLVHGARALGTKRALITSAHGMMRNASANLLVGDSANYLAEHQTIANAPNGPGDLSAALLLGHLLEGASEEVALRKTTSAVFEILARSVKSGSDELLIQREASSLKHPMAMINMRKLLA